MGLVQIADDFFLPSDFSENHHYFSDAEGTKEYTGITTILRVMAKPQLIPWAARMAVEYVKEHGQEEVSTDGSKCWLVDEQDLEAARVAHTKKKEKAGEHGTSVHSLCEIYIKELLGKWAGKPQEMDASPVIEQFIEWARENVDHFLFAERPVHSRSLFLAGTIDFGAVMKDGTRRVGDLKTGSGIYYESILQTEFYQMLAEEEGDEKYNGSVIVNLKKTGEFQTQTRERSEIDKAAALGLLAAYRGNATFTKK